MEYFDLEGLGNYRDYVGEKYKADTAAAKWFYDTRDKLIHLVSLVSSELKKDFKVVYKEKPNGQAGRSKIVFKDYVLIGFSTTRDNGDDIFMKFEFSNLKASPQFAVNIDLNFRKGTSPFHSRRDSIFNRHYRSWPLHEFPNNWNELLNLMKDPAIELESKLKSYLNELIDITNNPMKQSEVVQLLRYKKQIILQGPPGTGKTRLAKELADEITNSNMPVKYVLTEALVRKYCHPKLPIKSARDGVQYLIESIEANGVNVRNTQDKTYTATFAEIIRMYNERVWEVEGGIKQGNDSYNAAVAKYLYELLPLKENKPFVQVIQFHPSYSYEDFVRGIEVRSKGSHIEYVTINKTLGAFAKQALKDFNDSPLEKKNYVLIIDEINRANLSAVLGELIYGLEYRGKQVESMYEIDGSNGLTLPPNLYIIGTMNMADRSVGHIDYAIRRRFAFVDVMPKDLSGEEGISFDSELFKQVTSLFVKDYDPEKYTSSSVEQLKRSRFLCSEFTPREVWLGHSYFIDKTEEGASMQMRLEYEIKPILMEYLKDGVLLDGEGDAVLDIINQLKPSL